MSNPPIIRTSERRSAKECLQAWQWAWREGLKPRGEEADHFWFGTGIHLAFSEWYSGPGLKRGPHPVETWEEYCRDAHRTMRLSGHDDEAKWTDGVELGRSLLERYIDHYGNDDHWHIIAPEQTFQIDIPYRRKNGIMAIYAGTFDLVFRDLRTGRIKLGEHKTAANISLTHLQIDDQAGAYWAIAHKVLVSQGLIKESDRIEAITYNFVRKALPDVRPENEDGLKLNKNGTISKRQPKHPFLRYDVDRSPRERATQLRRIQNEATWMDLARRHPDAITKNPRYDCARRCQFYELCEIHERGGRDFEDYKKAMFRVEDPYKDHRKSASE